jgi:hypothetical protein
MRLRTFLLLTGEIALEVLGPSFLYFSIPPHMKISQT